MKNLYKRTIKKENKIKELGYNLQTKWECEFSPLNNTTRDLESLEPLNPRDAFYGGRCEPTKLLAECPVNCKIVYNDFVSLYPTVNYYDEYPTNHEVKIYSPEYYDKNWFGFIKCKVIPPRKLYHPVLPYRQACDGARKLLFPLCAECSKRIDDVCIHTNSNHQCINCVKQGVKCHHRKLLKKNCKECYDNRNQRCNHNDEERTLTGTWLTIEMNKAIEKGYKITKIYEVWHFEQTSRELFKEYVRTFMKIKLEASGLPEGMTKEKYVEESLTKHNIKLDIDKIDFNPGLRFIAKLCLSSLWGGFGKRTNMKQTEYIEDLDKYYALLNNDTIKNLNMIFINDRTIKATYIYKDKFEKETFDTNIHIAAFTTAHARLRLYNVLDKLGRAVLYYDTDSIIYIDDGTNTLLLETSLGELSDELKGRYILLFLGMASKDYDYIDNEGKASGKIKGFKANSETEFKLSMNHKIQVLKGEVDSVIINYTQLKIDGNTSTIVTREQTKEYTFGYNKRQIIENYDTVPYGF